MKNPKSEIEPIFFETDLYKRYSERRKNMPVEEVRDLFECIIKYMKQEMTQKNSHYAVKFGDLGYMYRKPHKKNPETFQELRTPLMEDIWMELCYNTKGKSKSHYLDRDDLFDRIKYEGKTLEDIQKEQNEDNYYS